MISDSSPPVCLARELPILFTSLTVLSPQAPKVSSGNGMKAIPAVLQSSPCLDIFRSKATCSAWPGFSADLSIRVCCRGFITVISKAVSNPPDQEGRYMSAGLACLPGIKALSSLVDPRQACTQVENKQSLMASCLYVRSPPHPHDIAWWRWPT